MRDMAAALRGMKPTLKSIDLLLPGRGLVVVTHKLGERLLVFDLGQESEGFRRLLACLLALYQTPPKQTLIFDEPEKGNLSRLVWRSLPTSSRVLHAKERGLGQVILDVNTQSTISRPFCARADSCRRDASDYMTC